MSDIEEIDDISQNGDEEVDSVVASDVEESDIEGTDDVGSEVGSDDDGSDIDGELSEEEPVNEDPQDQSQSQGGSFLDMLGGAPPDEQDELDEDILGENNKLLCVPQSSDT